MSYRSVTPEEVVEFMTANKKQIKTLFKTGIKIKNIWQETGADSVMTQSTFGNWISRNWKLRQTVDELIRQNMKKIEKLRQMKVKWQDIPESLGLRIDNKTIQSRYCHLKRKEEVVETVAKEAVKTVSYVDETVLKDRKSPEIKTKKQLKRAINRFTKD
jgi:hypothetical protein